MRSLLGIDSEGHHSSIPTGRVPNADGTHRPAADFPPSSPYLRHEELVIQWQPIGSSLGRLHQVPFDWVR
jgi:hypothetical protein